MKFACSTKNLVAYPEVNSSAHCRPYNLPDADHFGPPPLLTLGERGRGCWKHGDVQYTCQTILLNYWWSFDTNEKTVMRMGAGGWIRKPEHSLGSTVGLVDLGSGIGDTCVAETLCLSPRKSTKARNTLNYLRGKADKVCGLFLGDWWDAFHKHEQDVPLHKRIIRFHARDGNMSSAPMGQPHSESRPNV